jgi:hypothetical protein
MERQVRQRVALTIVLLTPLVLLGVVMRFISVTRPSMNAPPVGAGSQSTGGANAIGEYLAHGSAKRHDEAAVEHLVSPETLAQGFLLRVQDQARLAGPDSPIYMACNLNHWNRADPAWKLEQQPSGRWEISVAHPSNNEALEFTFFCGGREEVEANGGAMPHRRLVAVDVSRLAPGEQPRIELSVSRWAERAPADGDAKK